MNKIYLVMESDDCDSVCAIGAFSDKEKAEKYCELQNKLSDYYSFYVSDVDFLDDYDVNRDVKPYYSYYIGKEQPNDFNQAIRFDYYEIKEWLIKNAYINVEELKEVEEKDNTLNEVGNPTHLMCGDYIKAHISEDIMKKLLEFDNSPEMQWSNDDETENRIYDQDLVVIDNDDYIQVFSVNSFDEAKKKALELYENWKNT